MTQSVDSPYLRDSRELPEDFNEHGAQARMRMVELTTSMYTPKRHEAAKAKYMGHAANGSHSKVSQHKTRCTANKFLPDTEFNSQ